MKFTWLLALMLMTQTPATWAASQLNGAGASFPYPIYSKWFAEYQKKHSDVRFNYRPIGSGGGVRQLLAGTVDFGASDVPMLDEEKSKVDYPVLQIPMVIGAVVVVYNLGNDAPQLVLDGATVASIFLGKITKWNDTAIAQLNPKAKLPNKAIAVAHRADSSGTTAVFTGYLASVSSEWKEQVGEGKSVKWKAGFGGKGNDGVAGIVKQTEGTIGYVELAFALTNSLKYTSLKNAKGKVVKPQLEAISASAKGLVKKLSSAKNNELIGDISNSDDASAYPIASLTYLLLPKKDDNLDQRKELKKFVTWAMDNGDQMAKGLHYAPLPQDMKKLVKERLNQL